MTEPSDRRAASPYDAAVSALALAAAAEAGALPGAVVIDRSAVAAPAGGASEAARACIAACHAKGVAAVAAAGDAAGAAELRRLLVGCEARVMVLAPTGDPGAAARDIKAETGVACEAMVWFSSDPGTLRSAARAGATTVRLGVAAAAAAAAGAAPAAAGDGDSGDGGGGRDGACLTPAALQRGLRAHESKLQDSRGY